MIAVSVGVALTASLVVGCTPKPNDAAPAAADFLDAVESQDYDALASLVDDPTTAADSIRASWEGLQAESLDITVTEVSQQDNLATVKYTMTWQLPRDRHYTYDSAATLTQSSDTWTVRWRPSVMNPRLGAHQHMELRAEPATKASVVSSDGVELLSPGTVYRILVDTDQMRDPAATATTISTALDVAREGRQAVPRRDPAELKEQLRAAAGSFSVAVVPANAKDAVAAAVSGDPSIRLNEEAAMITVNPGFAPDIMARVAELVRDDLEGAAGWSVNVVNSNGAFIEELTGEAATPAPAIHISLDHAVQRAAEKALEPIAGQQAMIVAIRPSTGGILAVAQTPAADALGNLATMGQYPPGSTFKIITAAAGIEKQGLNPDTIVACPGTMILYGRIVTNYAGFSMGNVPLRSAFARSCNTTFADISTKLAPGELKETGKQFGLGVDMKIAGLDTITGSIPVGEEALDRTEAGYGQGHDLVSPFGMALVAATAARGLMPVPFLVDGQKTEVSEDVRKLSPEVEGALQQIMQAVTAPGGTAAGMSAGGDIRGKTGEAEIYGGSHSWFTGYRANDDIAFATLIVLGGGSEAAVAVTDRMLINLDESRKTGG